MASQPVILIVDSDILVRFQLAEYLRECGYRVIEASTSDEACVFLGENGLDIGTVLTDVRVTGSLDGFGLANWIRANVAAIDVILAGSLEKSVSATSDLCQDGPDIGKPYEHHLVLDRIRRLMADRSRKRR